MRRLNLLLAALFFGLIGCAALPPTPSDFNLVFKYGVGAKNELNTFAGTYTKDMIGPPFFITMNLPLSQEELDKIYKKMVEINFFDYPDEFSVSIPAGAPMTTTTPYYSYSFRVEYASKSKELQWHDKIVYRDEKSEKLKELINLIQGIIESKPEYKKLPEPTSAYSWLIQ